LALNNLGLGFVFTARDLASGAIRTLEQNFSSLDRRVGLGAARIQSAFQELGVGTALLSAGAIGAGATLAMANAAGKFEQAIAGVAAVSGASARELEMLRQAAIEAGVRTQYSPVEAALGLRDLGQAGFDARESVELLIPVLDLAGGSLGELSPQQAAGLAAQGLKAFGLSITDASVTVDRLLKSVNLFALSASELPLALGTASRGAQALHQSLSETVIALGLVKNVIPGVERASTAVAVAMERLVAPEAQERLRAMGVAVTDATGRFRPFLDVIGELAPELQKMTDANRSAFLLKTFGREALSGVNAILTQLTTGIRGSQGAVVAGAAAITDLRAQFENAGGTAAKFREQMLDTFEGQKLLLTGSLQTLAVVLGEPFARVFKPLVSAAITSVNALLEAVRGMPAPMKRALSGLATAAAAIAMVVGAVISAKASVAIFAVGLKALGLTLGGLVATVLPAVLATTALGLSVAAAAYAFKENLGGIADTARAAWARVTLGVRALAQLIEGGALSGAVREELGRAEHLGLKRFVIAVFQLGYRLGRVWEGITDGFTTTMRSAAPVFAALAEAASSFGAELGGALSSITGSTATVASERFRAFGETIGAALAQAVTVAARFATAVLRVYGGVVAGVQAMRVVLAPAFGLVTSALTSLGGAWEKLSGAVAGGSRFAADSGQVWTTLGKVIGETFGAAVSVFAVVVSGAIDSVVTFLTVLNALREGALAVAGALGAVGSWIARVFTETIPDAVRSAWAVVQPFAALVGDLLSDLSRRVGRVYAGIGAAITAAIRLEAELVMGAVEALSRALAAVVSGVRSILQKVPKALLPDALSSFATPSATTSVAEPLPARAVDTPSPAAVLPAVAETRARTSAFDALAAGLGRTTERSEPAPIAVNVQVDGETIARATARAAQSSADRAFSPVPVF
jgi:TP901 family phage tail tape measure protein